MESCPNHVDLSNQVTENKERIRALGGEVGEIKQGMGVLKREVGEVKKTQHRWGGALAIIVLLVAPLLKYLFDALAHAVGGP